jgi:hypothetical protein
MPQWRRRISITRFRATKEEEVTIPETIALAFDTIVCVIGLIVYIVRRAP